MRLALVFVIGCFGACSGTAAPKDPYAGGTCDSHWQANGFTDCEAGCADSAMVLEAKGSACAAMTETGSAFSCIATQEFGSAVGCCVSDKPRLYFAECQ